MAADYYKMVQHTLLSEGKKDTLARICRKLEAISKETRRTGLLLLALEDVIEGIAAEFGGKNGKYARKLLMLVAHGYEQEIIRGIADNYIASSCQNEFEVLCFTLIKTGACTIQDGTPPAILAERFVSYIGFDGEEDFRQRTGFVEK